MWKQGPHTISLAVVSRTCVGYPLFRWVCSCGTMGTHRPTMISDAALNLGLRHAKRYNEREAAK